MESKMQFATYGYSGFCIIKPNKSEANKSEANNLHSLLSSFQITVNTKMLYSDAVDKIYKSNDQENNNFVFNKLGLNAIRDFPVYDIGLSFQCNFNFYNAMMTEMLNGFKNSFLVELQDTHYNFKYVFNQCYVNNFSVSVEQNSVCVLNIGFSYFHSDFQLLKASLKEEVEGAVYGIGKNIGDMMPYFSFGVDFYNATGDTTGDTTGDSTGDSIFSGGNLLSFNFNYTREVIPKFGCIGSFKEINALKPVKIYFALPVANISLNYLYNQHLLSQNVFNDYLLSSNNSLQYKLQINYSYSKSIIQTNPKTNDITVITKKYTNNLSLTRCGIEDYLPSLARASTYNTINLSMRVLGKISFQSSIK